MIYTRKRRTVCNACEKNVDQNDYKNILHAVDSISITHRKLVTHTAHTKKQKRDESEASNGERRW